MDKITEGQIRIHSMSVVSFVVLERLYDPPSNYWKSKLRPWKIIILDKTNSRVTIVSEDRLIVDTKVIGQYHNLDLLKDLYG